MKSVSVGLHRGLLPVVVYHGPLLVTRFGFGVSNHSTDRQLNWNFSHYKEWNQVWCGTKEDGRKAIRSLFGPGNKWGYDCTGKRRCNNCL